MIAVCNVGHPFSMESFALTMERVGVKCVLPSASLYSKLKALGCDTLVDPAVVAEGWGDTYFPRLPRVDEFPDGCLYVDTKAHRNGPKVWVKYPELERRTLWYRINGGKPVDVPGKGPEVDPPCPVLTPDLWYRGRPDACAFWPPFSRWNKHQLRRSPLYVSPVCLVNNLHGWCYGEAGVKLNHRICLRCYGSHGSPSGVLQHRSIPGVLRSAVCMVHLKSVDAPGYSVYECLASGCPLVLPERFIHRCQAQELLVPGVTCLTFDRRDEPEPIDQQQCVEEVVEACKQLEDAAFNRRIGEAGREALCSVLSKDWGPDLDAFMRGHYGL